MRKYIIVFFILLLPSCKKVKIGSEFSTLQKKTASSTGSTIFLDNALIDNIENIAIKNNISIGLTKNEAVSIALQNNPGLQADFQSLGIAKADLIQAGIYNNPTVNSVFRFPTRDQGPGTGQTNIESIAAFRLSDLWQVPLSKRVAEDILEIVSLRIFSTILTIVAETKMAYDKVLATTMQFNNTRSLLDTTKELRDEIYYRQLYGYTSHLDKSFADARVGIIQTDLQNQRADIHKAYIHLKALMGIAPTSKPVMLTESLYQNIEIPTLKALDEYALTNRPEILAAQMKIKQYKDTIRLEKSKILKEVDIGLGYKQDFDRPFRGWGPYINIVLPIFDNNYAQIARAEFQLKQAENELIAEKIKIREEIRKPYKVILALKKEIDLYKKIIIPSHEKAIDYAYTYAATMQLTMVTALESKIKLYQANIELIENYYHLMQEQALLERALGKKLDSIEMKDETSECV